MESLDFSLKSQLRSKLLTRKLKKVCLPKSVYSLFVTICLSSITQFNKQSAASMLRRSNT